MQEFELWKQPGGGIRAQQISICTSLKEDQGLFSHPGLYKWA